MDTSSMDRLNYGDIVEWTGDNPDTFTVVGIFPGNSISSDAYAYRDWCWRLKSIKDGHTELIGGCDMENIHFIRK